MLTPTQASSPFSLRPEDFFKAEYKTEQTPRCMPEEHALTRNDIATTGKEARNETRVQC